VDQRTTKPEMATLATMITAYKVTIDRTSWRHNDKDNRDHLRAGRLLELRTYGPGTHHHHSPPTHGNGRNRSG